MGATTGVVSVTARDLLKQAVKRSGRRASVQLPEDFARIQQAGATATPLSVLFGMGEVPMKLYLTLVMLTRQPPHELFRPVPDHYWAELLGYEELSDHNPTPGNGTRRVKRAFSALEKDSTVGDRGWIQKKSIPGRGATLTVTHLPETRRPPWIGLPLELWSRGWLNILSARGLFVYLCLQLMLAGRPDTRGTHVSTWDRERFCIGADTWKRGVAELEALGLLQTSRAKVVVDRWSTDLRDRKVYYLKTAHMMENDSPTTPVGR